MEKTNSKKLNILVIDDEEEICKLLHKIFGKIGYHSEGFTESSRALARFDEQNFDVVITDFMMPGLNGFDVAKQVKKKNPSVLVILITGVNTVYNDEYMVQSGIDFLVRKPFTVDKIRKVLGKAIKSKESCE